MKNEISLYNWNWESIKIHMSDKATVCAFWTAHLSCKSSIWNSNIFSFYYWLNGQSALFYMTFTFDSTLIFIWKQLLVAFRRTHIWLSSSENSFNSEKYFRKISRRGSKEGFVFQKLFLTFQKSCQTNSKNWWIKWINWVNHLRLFDGIQIQDYNNVYHRTLFI